MNLGPTIYNRCNTPEKKEKEKKEEQEEEEGKGKERQKEEEKERRRRRRRKAKRRRRRNHCSPESPQGQTLTQPSGPFYVAITEYHSLEVSLAHGSGTGKSREGLPVPQWHSRGHPMARQSKSAESLLLK